MDAISLQVIQVSASKLFRTKHISEATQIPVACARRKLHDSRFFLLAQLSLYYIIYLIHFYWVNLEQTMGIRFVDDVALVYLLHQCLLHFEIMTGQQSILAAEILLLQTQKHSENRVKWRIYMQE